MIFHSPPGRILRRSDKFYPSNVGGANQCTSLLFHLVTGPPPRFRRALGFNSRYSRAVTPTRKPGGLPIILHDIEGK